MKINEIDFKTVESVRKKCITFAKDGNTVLKPYRTLYSLENITHDAVHKNLYLEVVKGREWEETRYQLWEDFQVICVSQGWVHGSFDADRFAEMKPGYPRFGRDGFYKNLEEAERNGCHINKVDIEICALLGDTGLAKHYAEYRENRMAVREAERRAETEERERKERDEKEKRLAEMEKIIGDAENRIFCREELENIKVDGKSVINHLMKKYGIKVPLRTQGWINSKLVMIIFDGGKISYRFYGKSQRDNSTVFMKYLVELENAVRNSVMAAAGN